MDLTAKFMLHLIIIINLNKLQVNDPLADVNKNESY